MKYESGSFIFRISSNMFVTAPFSPQSSYDNFFIGTCKLYFCVDNAIFL